MSEELVNSLSDSMVLKIPFGIAQKVKFMVNHPDEWAGWLIGDINKGIIEVTDLIIPPQEVSKVQVEIGGSESDMWLLKNHVDKIDRIVGHIHSHNTMSAFFSGGDRDNHKKLIQTKKHLCFIVVAKAKDENMLFEYQTTFCFKNSAYGVTTYNELPCVVSIDAPNISKEITKLFNKIKELRTELNLLEGVAKEKVNKSLEGIKEDAEKELKEKLKSPVSNVWRSDDNKPKESYSFPHTFSVGQDNWVYVEEDLTEEEKKHIVEEIIGNNEYFNKLANRMSIEGYVRNGEHYYTLKVDCRKKKVMERLKEEVNKYLFDIPESEFRQVKMEEFDGY